jgi:sRNA-binding carbon storage regulator CsrA
VITLCAVLRGKVRIGVEAPAHMQIHRGEIEARLRPVPKPNHPNATEGPTIDQVTIAAPTKTRD